MNHEPREGHILGLGPDGFHKVAFLDWGDPENPDVLVCVHGLSRNSHDFDYLARALQHRYRIVCPDVVGRGKSDFTGVSATYSMTNYINDMVALIAHIGVDSVSWLGTSMGGMIGMLIASKPNSPIKKLILNDVGMVIPKGAIAFIQSYMAIYPEFSTLNEARQDMQMRLSGFGLRSEEHIQHMLKYTFKKSENGTYHYAYDPSLVEAVGKSDIFTDQDFHMEPIWQAIQCPTLIIRGGVSKLLLKETAEAMVAMRPGTDLVEIPDVGHAPALMEDDQIKIIADWLAYN